MRRLMTAAGVVGIVALTGACTPSELDGWTAWWHDDPQAAEEFAQQEWVKRSLEWGCDSYCDVDDPELQGESDNDGSSEEVTTESSNDEASEYDGDRGEDTGGVYWPWTELAQCESGGNWHIDTGNGYYGGLQFSWGSWEAAGGSGNPAHASPSEQVRRGEILQDMQGWGAWPTCASIIGLL
jgi:transglycosylase-like protein